MVTKLGIIESSSISRLILAKNHMVTKHIIYIPIRRISLILAKNHMVTKQLVDWLQN